MRTLARVFAVAVVISGPILAVEAEPPADDGREVRELEIEWGLEAKAHYRDSQGLRLASPFPFPASFLPAGQSKAFMETVNEGQHFELSTLTLFGDAAWGDHLTAHLKIDFIDLYDRNPTSSDKKVDVDELWIRFGADPDLPSKRFALAAKVGKFAHFERQNDRHLESYGLIATAFNRFEDQGFELAANFGSHFYLRASATQGNPLFFRDPNALAGDNGTPELDPVANPNPNPALKSGFPILYDAEVEDLDVDGDLELGYGVGVRFGEPGSGREVNLMGWSYSRDLADTVDLEGTFYGGDLDLLNGPFDSASLPISGRKKEEVGGNLWVYFDGFSLFAQYVDQELAGMDRTGYETEVAWRFELPLVAAVGGRQLFPAIQPVVRYSYLEPKFSGGGPFPAPSVRWEWVKLDYGIRLGLVPGIDLTVEYQDNTFTLANGTEQSNDELLATLRWKV